MSVDLTQEERARIETWLASQPEPDPDDPDNPERNVEDFARAQGPESLSEAELDAFPLTRARLRGAQKASAKEPVSIRLDADVVAWFRGTGDGWRTRISDILRRSPPTDAAATKPG